MLPFQIAQNSVRIKAPNIVFQTQAVALDTSLAGHANRQTRKLPHAAPSLLLYFSIIWTMCMKRAHRRNANSVDVRPSVRPFRTWGHQGKLLSEFGVGVYRSVVNSSLHQAEI